MTQASPSKLPQPERLLRLSEVEFRVSLGKSSIYDGIKRGTFPAPLKLSRRAVCWPSSAIDAWIAERIEAGAASRPQSEQSRGGPPADTSPERCKVANRSQREQSGGARD